MNTLCPKPHTESLTWNWIIRVAIHENGSFIESHPVELHLSRKDGPWKCRIDELESILSLWLCSVDEAREVSVNKVQTENRHDDDEWIRRKTSWAEGGLVLFGEYCEQLEKALGWWMPADAPKLSIIDERTKEDRFEPWRIIGTESSYTTQISAFKSNQVPEEPVDDTTLTTKSPRQFLSIEVNDGLEQLYARHIFHAFISAAAAKMDNPIDDHSDMDTSIGLTPGEWRNPRLRGKNLTRLAGAIRDSGLMDLNQAYLSLIPPLHANARLGELDSVIEAAFTQAKHHQRLLNWEAAGKTYTALLDVIKTSHPDSYTLRKVVALADDYIRTLNTLPKDPESLREPEVAEVRKTLLSILDRDNYKGFRKDLQILHGCQQGSGSASGEVSSCNFTKLHSHAATPDTTEWGSVRFGEMAYFEKLNNVKFEARSVSDELFMQVSGQDILGWTPLHYVAANKDMEAQAWVDELVRKQADVNVVDIRHRTALHYAILNRNITAFDALLKAGVDITTTGVDGMTPLHCAVLANSGDMVESLFSHSRQAVDQFARDNHGRAPIHLAALEGNIDPVKHFEASIEMKDLKGRTPLHLATMRGHLETIAELARYKANPNARYKPVGRDAEITALIWAIEKRKTKVVQRLIEAGADVHEKYIDRSPLHLASMYAGADIVGMLIDGGAFINSTDKFRQTSLFLAATSGRLGAIRRLIEQEDIGLNIHRHDKTLPVQMAAARSYFRTVELLVHKGAIIDKNTTLYVANAVKAKSKGQIEMQIYRADEEDKEDKEQTDEVERVKGAASGKKPYSTALYQQAVSLWKVWQSYAEEDGGVIIWEGMIRRLLLSYRK